MQMVRDQAIAEIDRTVHGELRSASAQVIHREVLEAGPSGRHLVDSITPDLVDAALHYLLLGLEHTELVTLCIRTSSGALLDAKIISDGLAGELYGPDGRVVRFSTTRPGKLTGP